MHNTWRTPCCAGLIITDHIRRWRMVNSMTFSVWNISVEKFLLLPKRLLDRSEKQKSSKKLNPKSNERSNKHKYWQNQTIILVYRMPAAVPRPQWPWRWPNNISLARSNKPSLTSRTDFLVLREGQFEPLVLLDLIPSRKIGGGVLFTGSWLTLPTTSHSWFVVSGSKLHHLDYLACKLVESNILKNST